MTLPQLLLGIPDRFIEHGSREDCLEAAGLDLAGITLAIEPWWGAQASRHARTG
jgi:1-deoxy-D-xylulose-5-phosphate synthase